MIYRILLPLISQLIMDALGLQRDISTFGFVFGTFPTAPSVFVFASLFKCGVSLVSSIASAWVYHISVVVLCCLSVLVRYFKFSELVVFC